VVFVDDLGDERWMQGVAADIGAPTTGFVDLPRAADDATVRFFTPKTEIDACGHVTVAVATALVEEGTWQPEAMRAWGVSSSGGRVPLLIGADEDGRAVLVTMRQRLAQFERRDDAAVGPILGQARLDSKLPIVVAGTGLRHLLVPVSSASDLAALVVEREPIERLSAEHGVDTVGVYALSDEDGDVEIRMRDLCAGIGAVEEPASGTTSGALALALQWIGAVPDSATIAVTMGVEMGRPSRLGVRLESGDDGGAANVSGTARRLLTGRLEV
jgi:trans-2,3-dihydro-3-hydroxyanthranilate isomerase